MTDDGNEALLARFEEYLVQSELAPSTIANYLADLRACLRWGAAERDGTFSLLSLTAEDILSYRDYLWRQEGRAPTTVNRRLQALRKFFAFALEMGYRPENPAGEVGPVRGERLSPLRPLSAGEVRDLLAVVQEGRPSLVRRDLAIMQLLLYVGLRVGELVQLRLSDLHLAEEYPFIAVPGGNDGLRELPLPPSVCQVLQTYLAVRPRVPGVEHLFLSQDGWPISARSVQRLVSIYGRLAGLEGVSPQLLRRTFVCYLLESTGDIALVAQRLGHRRVETTMRYITDE
jgi:site-specific recombinase XerD